jgi:subtilase family serine protease
MSAERIPGESRAAWSQGTPWGLSPQEIRAAYRFDGISFGAVAGDGTGQVIAIVDAYDNPRLVDRTAADFGSSDLARFDRQYGLPDPPSFLKVDRYGSPTNWPGTDPAGAGTSGNWEVEEALDVEWAHALAPGAGIILVECNSSDGPDLYQGARTAAALPGVSVVSLSWGSGEYSGEAQYNRDFTTPTGHQGVTFVAAAGDAGAPGLYPAYSPGVVAVGGTTLTIRGSHSYGGESAWPGSGGGTSTGEAEPAYQAGVQSLGMRTIPDVAFDADPGTGVAVYDSYDDTHGNGPWQEFGGTSLAAPAWGAILAIADQGRVLRGGTTLDGASQALPALYALPAGDFHDITGGSNGGFKAGPGYDEVTGLGTPRADLVVPDLAAYGIAGRLVVTAQPPAVITAGTPFGLVVQVENPAGSLDTAYLGTVTITLPVNPEGGTLSGTLNVTPSQGVATFTRLTLDTAATGDILRITTDGPAATMTISLVVVPATPARLVVIALPGTGGSAGAGFCLVATIEDAFGNVVTTYSGSVTLQRESNPHRAGRRATLAAAVSQGVATFSHVKLRYPDQGSTLQATAGSLTAMATIPLGRTIAQAKSFKEQARLIHLARQARPDPHGAHGRRARS